MWVRIVYLRTYFPAINFKFYCPLMNLGCINKDRQCISIHKLYLPHPKSLTVDPKRSFGISSKTKQRWMDGPGAISSKVVRFKVFCVFIVISRLNDIAPSWFSHQFLLGVVCMRSLKQCTHWHLQFDLSHFPLYHLTNIIVYMMQVDNLKILRATSQIWVVSCFDQTGG